MKWWRRNLRPPAAVSLPAAGHPPDPAVPPPGPLPRHDCGPIEYQVRKYEGGCIFIYDGDNNITAAFGCPTVADLRQWDRELRR